MPTCAAPVQVADFEGEPAAEGRLSRWWQRHSYILPSFLLSILVCGWFVTWGDGKLFEPEEFCGFYDAQALSMLDGRLDVPPAAVASEAFTFRGKTYGYFGIAPALLRLPLVVAFENMDGRWSRLMMMLGCTINLVCAYSILRLILGDREVDTRRERLLHSLFILGAGIGSTNLFLVARSFTYHEAIMWGGTFALLFTWILLKYFARPSYRLLVLAGCCAFMSFNSRPTAGAGTLLVLCVLSLILIGRALTRRELARSMLAFAVVTKPLQHALLATTAVIITLGVYFGVNYGRFHTLNGVPLQYYNFYKQIPVRIQLTGGKQIHLENVPTGLVNYFGVHGVRFDPKFPWLHPNRKPLIVGSPALDMVDEFSTFPVSMPALSLLALLGIPPLIRGPTAVIKRLRLPALALLIGGGIVLATVALCERYLHDFYPALIILAALGISQMRMEIQAAEKIAALALLTAIGIALNCSFALIHQRLRTGAPPAKVAEFRHWQKLFDQLLHKPATPQVR